MTYAQKLADQFSKNTQLESGIYHVSDINTIILMNPTKIVAPYVRI